jgi:ammonia channel protein AmtB
MIIWMVLDIIVGKSRRQNADFVSIPGLCSAAVVGLVVITPAAGYVQPGYALLMGLTGGFLIFILTILSMYSVACTAIIFLLMHFTIGIRINRFDQVRGLDNIAHGVMKQDQLQQMKMSNIQNKRDESNAISTIVTEK